MSIYYNYRKIFSYNTHIIAIIGARGIGKTYGAKRFVIKKFLNEGKKFIWIRDTEVACDELRVNDGDKFFTDIKHEFKKLKGSIKGEIITINDQHAGYIMPLSTYYNYKGSSYNDIEYIVFDEFIAESGQKVSYSRVQQFINTIETIGRLRNNFKIILLANALNRGDDILDLFNIKINGFGFYKNKKKSFILHYSENSPKYEEAKKLSISGRIIEGTPYADNLLRNKFNDDDNQYFDKRPPKCKLFAILHNADNSLRLYLKKGVLYACKDFNTETNNHIRYVNDIALVDTKRNLIPPSFLDAIKKCYISQNVYFENASIKNIFIEIIKKR